jgi:lactocepin
VTGSGKVYAGAGLQEGWNDQSGNGTWCYVRNGQVVTGWFLDAGSWYLADASGTMLTGWQQDAGHWYYLSQDHDGSFGAMRTGWLLDGGKWYWLSATTGGPLGAMATGWQLVGGTWYYLYPQTGAPKGSLAVSTTVDGYVVDANGAWVR